MAAIDYAVLKNNVTNADIIDALRSDMSLEYERRIPVATQAGLKDTLANLDQYNVHWNEFVSALVNRIGLVIARDISWTNPLAEFKMGMMNYGDTIEEAQMGLLEAHTYSFDHEYLERENFATEIPPVQTAFHTVNRQNYYKVSVNHSALKRAFLEEGGLAGFVNKLMQTPTTSDNLDEFLLTCRLFSEYERNGGFYHVNVPDVAELNSDQASAKRAIRKMRAMAENMKFISTKYNAAHMPVWAKPDDLILITTPEFQAAVDVEALAGAFNLEKLALTGRNITIPKDKIGIDGAQGFITTRDFFMIADTYFDTTSQINAAGRSINYFLHHDQIISASRFVPAIMLTTGADDEVISVRGSVDSVSALTIEAVNGVVPTSAARGGMVALKANAVSTLGANDDIGGVSWIVSGATTNKTFITSEGVLHVGGDETATTLTVTAVATWIDPDDPRRLPKTATKSVTVTGPVLPEWPVIGATTPLAVTVKGMKVPLVNGKTDYTVAVEGGTVKATDIKVTAEQGTDVNIAVAAGGKSFTATLDAGDSAPVVYTFTITAAA